MKPYFAKKIPVLADWGGSSTKYVGKLMLCSRDIQVGDEIYNNGGKLEFPVQSEREKEVFTRNGSFFKVIGEISPNAIWVKEGDEFEEEQWRSAMQDVDGTYVDFEKYIPLSEGYFVEIKCPTCKQFH